MFFLFFFFWQQGLGEGHSVMKLMSTKRKCQIKARKGLLGGKAVNGVFLAFSESDKISPPCATGLVNVGKDMKNFLSPGFRSSTTEWKQAPHPQERDFPAHFLTAALSFQKENSFSEFPPDPPSTPQNLVEAH